MILSSLCGRCAWLRRLKATQEETLQYVHMMDTNKDDLISMDEFATFLENFINYNAEKSLADQMEAMTDEEKEVYIKRADPGLPPQDRKSTRLNSSH